MKKRIDHHHNFNDDGINLIYCSVPINSSICPIAKDKKNNRIGVFEVVNGQGVISKYIDDEERKILGELIFNNPCHGCLNPDKQIKKLDVYDYQKLCMTHRKAHDEVFN